MAADVEDIDRVLRVGPALRRLAGFVDMVRIGCGSKALAAVG